MRATLVTKEEIDGARRKLAWFAKTSRGLYFEVGGFFLGSHSSYHVDGNVFRTSPATQGRARFEGTHVPLVEFRGWHQFGVSMLRKNQLSANPALKARDRRKGNVVSELSVLAFPSSTLNIVVELLHREQRGLLDQPDLQPRKGAVIRILELDELLVPLTILGHEENLLVKPATDGFQVSHHNSRYSANAPGVKYIWEAYG